MAIVLIVEDEERMRDSLARAFRARGVVVWTAASVEETKAVCAAHEEAPDVAVLDGNLDPSRFVCDSLPLIAWLKGRYPGIKLVAASAEADYQILMVTSGCDTAAAKDEIVAHVCDLLVFGE